MYIYIYIIALDICIYIYITVWKYTNIEMEILNYINVQIYNCMLIHFKLSPYTSRMVPWW